jgi:5-methylcytosine-specific restriction protein A
MAAFILTWNPRWSDWPADEFNSAVRATAMGKAFPDRWSVGIRKHGISVGDRAFMLRQHDRRGIVASARITSGVFEDKHWDDPSKTTTYINLEWDAVLPVEDRLPVEHLRSAVPAVGWDRVQGSGVKLPPPAAAQLEALWHAHRDGLVFHSPEELPAQELGREGAVTRIEVNRYERDSRARKRCVERWGVSCSACGLNFAEEYGEVGKDFIHVHHLRALSEIGEEYQVDPVADLRPVCPNCHAMLHRAHPMLTVDELKKRLRTR